MKAIVTFAAIIGALALLLAAPLATQPANYFEGNTSRLVIGGTQTVNSGGVVNAESGAVINVKTGAALQFNAVDKTDILAAGVANPLAGVAASYRLARGVDAVTGTLDKTTGLTTVVACGVGLAEDAALTGLLVSYVIPTQSGGTAGHVTLKVWKATAANDVTPIAATAAKNVGWNCTGT